ncbi:Uncharacterised protein [Leclercia adecarboxylata]|nr:Uncharacterised protein [Leclercia adecarboxylata]
MTVSLFAETTFSAISPASNPLIIPAPAMAGTIGPNTPETVSIKRDTRLLRPFVAVGAFSFPCPSTLSICSYQLFTFGPIIT